LKPFSGLVILAFLGCAPKMLLPPNHITAGECPQTERPSGHTLGMSIYHAFFEFNGLTGSAYLVQGLAKGLDIKAILSVNQLGAEPSPNLNPGFDPNIYSSNLRMKYNPGFAEGIWAITMGIGLGSFGSRRFYSFEHAQIVGKQFRLCTPYLHLKLSTSFPVDKSPVTWRYIEDKYYLDSRFFDHDTVTFTKLPKKNDEFGDVIWNPSAIFGRAGSQARHHKI
jgi:hypothetical protein